MNKIKHSNAKRGQAAHKVKHIEWFAKMILGWVCYTWFMRKSEIKMTTLELWALSWAGFYAFDTGFENWLESDI